MPQSQASQALVHDWPAGLARSLPRAPWLVVHAKPRQEKALTRDLADGCLPGLILYEKRLRSYPGKGQQVTLVPLLGGYIFVNAGREAQERIYRTERAVRLIIPPRPEQLAEELSDLIALLARATGPVVVRPELVPGAKVEIAKGTFAGCRAVVLRRANAVELIINIELLGHAVSVQVPAETIG